MTDAVAQSADRSAAAAPTRANRAALDGCAADPPVGPVWVDPGSPSAVNGPHAGNAPFPWAGGSVGAANVVWRAFGDADAAPEPEPLPLGADRDGREACTLCGDYCLQR